MEYMEEQMDRQIGASLQEPLKRKVFVVFVEYEYEGVDTESMRVYFNEKQAQDYGRSLDKKYGYNTCILEREIL